MAFTFFFRDSQTLELAIDDALPKLCGRAFIHVWDAGCAHGPEAYTLAILLRERMSDYVFRNVRIHATDIDSSFADQVTSGIFAEHEVQRVPPEVLQKYFQPAQVAPAQVAPAQVAPAQVAPAQVAPASGRCEKCLAGAEETPAGCRCHQTLAGCRCHQTLAGCRWHSGCVQVAQELRERVTFSHHDLLSLRPPREDFSLIVCKNVLLHFSEAQRVAVIRMFHRALQPGGTLVMEHTQKLPDALAPCFEQVAPHAQVFRKVEPAGVEAGPATPSSTPRWIPRGCGDTRAHSPHWQTAPSPGSRLGRAV